MTDARVERRAEELRAMLDAGDLDGAGPIDLEHRRVASARLAAQIVLADLDHLLMVAEHADIDPERWDLLARDLEWLVWLASARRLILRQDGHA